VERDGRHGDGGHTTHLDSEVTRRAPGRMLAADEAGPGGPSRWRAFARRSRSLRLVSVTICFALFGLMFARRQRAATHAPSGAAPGGVDVNVPHVTGSITLDGDADDVGWRGSTLRTGAFVGPDGLAPVHPYSEARIVWGDGFLYLNLYAADEDIRALGKTTDSLAPDEDAFHLVFRSGTTERVFDINPLGVVTDGVRERGGPLDLSWDSHSHVSHELDGTANQSNDNDEEWVLEVAIPFASLGLRGTPGERIGLAMHRCDTTHRGQRVCGAWGEAGAGKRLVLGPP